MDVESKCHHCFKPSKYFCSRTDPSMCLTLASLFGLFVCNICTCSICLSAQPVSFLFLFFSHSVLFVLRVCLRENPLETYCGSYANFSDNSLGEENILPIENVHGDTTPCMQWCGHPYVRVCSSSSLSVCKCVLHALPTLAEVEFIIANIKQDYKKPSSSSDARHGAFCGPFSEICWKFLQRASWLTH